MCWVTAALCLKTGICIYLSLTGSHWSLPKVKEKDVPRSLGLGPVSKDRYL